MLLRCLEYKHRRYIFSPLKKKEIHIGNMNMGKMSIFLYKDRLQSSRIATVPFHLFKTDGYIVNIIGCTRNLIWHECARKQHLPLFDECQGVWGESRPRRSAGDGSVRREPSGSAQCARAGERRHVDTIRSEQCADRERHGRVTLYANITYLCYFNQWLVLITPVNIASNFVIIICSV